MPTICACYRHKHLADKYIENDKTERLNRHEECWNNYWLLKIDINIKYDCIFYHYNEHYNIPIKNTNTV